jgi:hypothetical protein
VTEDELKTIEKKGGRLDGKLDYGGISESQKERLFSITTILEKLLKRKYSPSDPRQMVTILYVRQILARQGLSYTVTV